MAVNNDIEEITANILGLVEYLIDTIRISVKQIDSEAVEYTKMVAYATSASFINLLDDIFDFYADEWPIVNANQQNYIALIDEYANLVKSDINAQSSMLNETLDTVLDALEKQLNSIEHKVDSYYDERIKIIYGYLAQLGEALNVPAYFLESNIENARSFAMSVSCMEGLSYSQFELDWSSGLNNLINKINSNITAYKNNPNRIKNDIRNGMLIPIFNVISNNLNTREQRLKNIESKFESLNNIININKQELTDKLQAISSIITNQIFPNIAAIAVSFDEWKANVYDSDRENNRKSFVDMFISIVSLESLINGIEKLLDYPADVLGRVDKLAGDIRTEQELKILNITMRRFYDTTDDWSKVVETNRGV